MPFERLVEFHDARRVPLSKQQRKERQGQFRYYGAQGVIDHIDDFIFDGRYLLVAEDGENLNSRKKPIAFTAEGQFWVNNHAHVVQVVDGVSDHDFVRAAVEVHPLNGLITGAAQPKLSQKNLKRMEIYVPSYRMQRRIGAAIRAVDDLIDNNRRRIEILEEMARLLYREWFVHLRFPGHEDIETVDSDLGLIPAGWRVLTVQELQSNVPNATAAGPFGSKLGRKDYVSEGVPVIRGGNLRVGGGFIDGDFVYVTVEKAETLRSSMARAGDVVVTQRGTLGQSALIPPNAKFDEYVVSQSQMKLTCNQDLVLPIVIYMQLALPEGIQRVLNMATGAGVPHINLGMFREMDMVVPPVSLQHKYFEHVAPYLELAKNLREQNVVLRHARDLLLPRLVSGELDVSDLDLDRVLA